MKRKYSYWWDFDWDGDILKWVIIESDNPKYPVVRRFTWSGQYAGKAITVAENIIKDLRDGRTCIKQAYSATCERI